VHGGSGGGGQVAGTAVVVLHGGGVGGQVTTGSAVVVAHGGGVGGQVTGSAVVAHGGGVGGQVMGSVVVAHGGGVGGHVGGPIVRGALVVPTIVFWLLTWDAAATTKRKTKASLFLINNMAFDWSWGLVVVVASSRYDQPWKSDTGLMCGVSLSRSRKTSRSASSSSHA
jgi:hypothetical protein